MQPFYDSAMIGEIHKAMLYRNEPERVSRNGGGLIFAGDHHTHHISGEGGTWRCDCRFFIGRDICSHTIALEYQERQMGPAFQKMFGNLRALPPAQAPMDQQ